MTNRARLRTLLAVGSLFFVSAVSQASAGSATTDSFVANVRPNVDFLDRASRMALDKTRNPGIRAFAHRQAVDQTIAANSLVAWTQANTLPGTAVALGTPVLPSFATSSVVEPLPNPAAASADVVTGRSAAEGGRPLTVTLAPRQPGGPTADDTLARLSSLNGRAFDTLYVSTQREALRQLSASYALYARSGDDAGLRAMATRELPKINRSQVELRRF